MANSQSHQRSRCGDLNPNFYTLVKHQQLNMIKQSKNNSSFWDNRFHRGSQYQVQPGLSSNQTATQITRTGLWVGLRHNFSHLLCSLTPRINAVATVVYSSLILACSLVYNVDIKNNERKKQESDTIYYSNNGCCGHRITTLADRLRDLLSKAGPNQKETSELLSCVGATSNIDQYGSVKKTSHVFESACAYLSDGRDHFFPRRQCHHQHMESSPSGANTTPSITSAIFTSCIISWDTLVNNCVWQRESGQKLFAKNDHKSDEKDSPLIDKQNPLGLAYGNLTKASRPPPKEFEKHVEAGKCAVQPYDWEANEERKPSKINKHDSQRPVYLLPLLLVPELCV